VVNVWVEPVEMVLKLGLSPTFGTSAVGNDENGMGICSQHSALNTVWRYTSQRKRSCNTTVGCGGYVLFL